MSTPHDAQHGHGTGTPAETIFARHAGGDGPAMLTVPTGSLACEACITCVEERLRENPHVTGVRVDAPHEVAHVTVHEGMITAEELAELIADACGDRNAVPLRNPRSRRTRMHTPVSRRGLTATLATGLRRPLRSATPRWGTAATSATTCPTRAWRRRWKRTCAAASGSAWSWRSQSSSTRRWR